MSKISDHIYHIIKEQEFADPFNIEFDNDRLIKEFGNALKEDETNLLEFLQICNELFKDIRQNIFALFDKLRLAPEDLREFFFIAVNKYFLDLTPQLLNQVSAGVSHESEKTTFSKFTNANGQEVNAQLAVEIGGDILAELIGFSYQWNTNEKEFDTLGNLNPEIHGNLFHALWIYANIFLNLKNSAYHIVKYENGKVIVRSEKELKIENGLNGTLFLKNAGIIRANNNTQEFFFQFMQFYDKTFKKRIGVGDFTLKANVLSPIRGESDSTIKAKADSSLFVFYPHLLEDKLEYFDGLSLHDLLDLLILIEECIEKLHRKNVTDYSERQLNEIPIKFDKTQLVNFLVEATGHKIETVNKFIASITTNGNQPYFWREPFLEVNDFLYFSLAAIAAPNHVLYFDKWTSLSGYTLKLKEKKFADFVIKELTESQKNQYQFKFLELDKLKIDNEIFNTNILIETASLLLFIEIKLFDFPIESPEVDSALQLLGNATFDVEEKAKQIIENFDGQKELIKIIITNYTNFSGLQINNIPIADLTLFKNYVSVGNFRRAAVTFNEGKPIVNDGGIISYYKNEEEFNQNLKNFFADPLPVKHILQRLCLKEQQITPDVVKPKFIVDIIDHITDEQLMDSRMESLTGYLNYEYFGEPEDKVIKDALDQSIIYSLHEVFSQLSYAPYESYKNRITLYHNISKTKLLGFVHLAFFILKALEKLNGKKITKTKHFESIDYDPDEVFKILEKGKKTLSGNIRLSEFNIEDDTFTDIEERKIISFSIDLLSGLTPKQFNDEVLESTILPLALLQGLSKKYNVEFEFYTACGNIIDALNYAHKYQAARDFCEELLVLSIKNNKQSQGWNILFKCYTNQKSTFDASINGCLFLSSLSVLPEIPDYLAVEALYGALKYFRNFGFNELAKYTYENLQHFDLNEYDKQKVTLSYFNSFFQGEMQRDINILDQVINYVESKIDDIISFGELGVIPWLALFYNIERLKSVKQISYNRDIKKYIDKFENSINKKSVDAIRIKIIGDKEKPKEQFISAVLSAFETRSVRDFVHEAQHLSIIASNLLQFAIANVDIDGILLAGFAINDQSFTFKDISIETGSISPISKPVNKEFKLQLNNYKYYLLSSINLTNKQLLIWLFEDLGKVFCMTLNSKKEFNLYSLTNWNMKKMKQLHRKMGNFYFNAKKDSDGNARCLFSNPRSEPDYNDLVQKEDYKNLIKELSFTTLPFNIDVDEILIYSSIKMANYPHNLIQVSNDFVAAQKPICNVISIERFLEKSNNFYLNKEYSVSAWIPVDDQEPIISWGFNLLKPTLIKIKANISTSTYPKEFIKSDLNIFLAHGVTDGSGFKAVYANHAKKKGIIFPYEVFGKGKVAILFVCNSGSSHEAIFSNSVVSFSGELLKTGYESVVAPFWPFDVTMSKIWLEEFLDTFNQGYSISEAVWLANKRLSKYDSETSNIYYAPAGCLAMHLYGNPNVYVNQ